MARVGSTLAASLSSNARVGHSGASRSKFLDHEIDEAMQGAFIGEGDFEAQARQTLENLDRVLAGFNVTKSHSAEMVVYLTNPREHFERCVALYKEYAGEHRPAATLIGVSGLAFPHQLIEIRTVAHTD